MVSSVQYGDGTVGIIGGGRGGGGGGGRSGDGAWSRGASDGALTAHDALSALLPADPNAEWLANRAAAPYPLSRVAQVDVLRRAAAPVDSAAPAGNGMVTRALDGDGAGGGGRGVINAAAAQISRSFPASSAPVIGGFWAPPASTAATHRGRQGLTLVHFSA